MKNISLLGAVAPSPFFSRFAISVVLLIHHVAAITFTPVPSANLDLSQLGRVGLTGDFDGISLYQYQGQSELGFNGNGSQSVLARYPNGGFASVAASDASIMAMCNFVLNDGTMAGVIVAGNFTSLGGVESQGVALLNPNTSVVTSLSGISGKVSSVLCDQSSSTVYVGGSFTAANSTNAIAWVANNGWTNLPFQGFNGPVTSITKAANGHVIFGGSFTNLGNASVPMVQDAQVVNLSNATITSTASTTTTGYGSPANVVCKTSGTDGPGNTWLVADGATGSWRATFGYGFSPSKLRLWNTHEGGRGTKTWRYTAFPINGIMNFTYTDPATGATAYCTSECPLSNNASIQYQDFHFVNSVGQNEFQIDISAFYGSGGGLDGIELFQNDIFTYAINSFNEPTCANITLPSMATTTGAWTTAPSQQSASDYLTINLAAGYTPASATVVFMPDIKQSGNYTVNMYTPGCIQDSTCSSRGQVNVNGTMSPGVNFATSFFQSNNYDKYDQIFSGYIEAGTTAFRPTVTLSPVAGQAQNPLTVVAQRVGFTLTSGSQGSLNSIFEWNPALATVNTSDFSTSVYDQAGVSIGTGGGVNALTSSSTLTYVGGNFSTSTYDNIFSINSTASSALTGGGLNGPVMALFLNGTILYVGGNFSSTSKTTTTGLNNVAAYDTSSNAWVALGAGVNGRVDEIVPLAMNISGHSETVITVNGIFTQLQAFGSSSASAADGFAIWVPSLKNWLQNTNASTMLISGDLTAAVDVAYSSSSLYAGSISSASLAANNAVELATGFSKLPITFSTNSTQSSSSSLSKRATADQTINGVVTGLFYENGGRNVTILGGHFAASATNGSTINNLAFINGSNSDRVTGISSSVSVQSTVLTMAVANDTLWAGGSLSGTINGNAIGGFVVYDLATASTPTQPPALLGNNVIVNDIAVRSGNSDIFVGGSFQSAGALSCPAVCMYSTSLGQWNRPGTSLTGTANTMIWSSQTTLIVGGSLAISGTNTSLAKYDYTSSTWTAFNGASSIPGPVTAITAANSDISQIWVAGTANNGSTFLMMYDGTNWQSTGSSLGSSSNIRGLQVFSLTSNHGSTTMVPANQALMLTGSINVPGYGNASAVIYNGTAFTPYALTTSTSGNTGSLSQIFTQQQNFFTSPGGKLALGFIVLIGLGISLALIFLVVIAGVFLERARRKREGYMPAPTSMYDKSNNIARVPPHEIFENVGQGRNAGAQPPMI